MFSSLAVSLEASEEVFLLDRRLVSIISGANLRLGLDEEEEESETSGSGSFDVMAIGLLVSRDMLLLSLFGLSIAPLVDEDDDDDAWRECEEEDEWVVGLVSTG